MENQSPDRPSLVFSLMLFCLAAALLSLFTLGSPYFGSSTEAREAQVMQEIYLTQNWMVPRRNGIAPSKPPLAHWMGAAIATRTGIVDEFVARVPSLLAACLISILTGLVCMRAVSLFGGAFSSESHSLSGILPASILWTSYGFLSLARDARVDMVFSLWCMCCLYVFFSAAFRKGELGAGFNKLERRDWNLFALFLGLAVLSKGPLGLLLPLLICFVVAVCNEGLSQSLTTLLRPRAAWGIMLCISFSWYFAVWWSGSQDILQRQILFENVTRFAGGELVNSEPWWFYVPEFVRTLLPWSLIFIFFLFREGAIGRIRERFFHSFADKRLLLGRQFLWPFLIALLFFSFASGKRPSYLLPLYPLIALYLSVVILDRIESLSTKARLTLQRLLQLLTGVTVVVALVILMLLGAVVASSLGYLPVPHIRDEWRQYALVSSDFVFSHAAPLMSTLGVMLLLIGISIFPSSGALAKRWAYLSLGIVGSYSVAVCVGQGIKNELKAFPQQAEMVLGTVNPAAELCVLKDSRDELFDPLLFYLRRPVCVQPLEEFSNICTHGRQHARQKFVLVRSTVSETSPVTGSRPVLKLLQRGDQISGRRDRELTLLECR